MKGSEFEGPSRPGVELLTLSDVGAVSSRYAEYLELPQLRDHLSQFITASGQIEGIDGIGLTLWETRNMVPLILVYGFTDLSVFGTPENPTPDVAFAEQHDGFSHNVRQAYEGKVDTIMAFVNTSQRTMEDFAPHFPTGLRDIFLGAHVAGEKLSQADLITRAK